MEILDPEQMEELLAISWQVPRAWKIGGIINTSLSLVFLLARRLHFPIQHVGKPLWGACFILWMLGWVDRGHITASFYSGAQKLHMPFLLFSDILPLKNWGTFKIGTPKQNFSKDAAVFTCVDAFHIRTSIEESKSWQMPCANGVWFLFCLSLNFRGCNFHTFDS